MAENVREIRAPEPSPRPTEIPDPTRVLDRSDAADDGQPDESQQSAWQDARAAAEAEHSKSIGRHESDDPQSWEAQAAAAGDEAARFVDGQIEEHAAVRQAAAEEWAQATEEVATPQDDTETDTPAEFTSRLEELRVQGHGPQRHHDPTDEQLAARMGDPVVDSKTGQPELKGNGYVKAANHIDPMTGTTVDGVHGGIHRCGDFATRFDSAADFVAADRFMRDRFAQGGSAGDKAPISEVLGPDGHQRLTGYYHDPSAPGTLKSVDFAGGVIVASYLRDENGELQLRTMYARPAPFHPNELGEAEQ